MTSLPQRVEIMCTRVELNFYKRLKLGGLNEIEKREAIQFIKVKSNWFCSIKYSVSLCFKSKAIKLWKERRNVRIVYVIYRVTHKGWDFRDDCAEFFHRHSRLLVEQNWHISVLVNLVYPQNTKLSAETKYQGYKYL